MDVVSLATAVEGLAGSGMTLVALGFGAAVASSAAMLPAWSSVPIRPS
jgi:hypothetical protein